jgi:Cu-Zn family superoxide dismutase
MNRFVVVSLIVVGAAGCSRTTSVGSPAPGPVAAPAAPPSAPIPIQATASLIDAASKNIGTVNFTDTPAGLLVIGTVSGLGIGTHGIHLHTVGMCEPSGFSSAGGHFNPTGAKHGFRNPAGHHAGDIPNIVTQAAGKHGFQFIVTGVRLTGDGGLLDADGASIVIHSVADDYMTDPSGNSGARLACGVIKATP